MSTSTRLRCVLAVMDYFFFGLGGLCISVVLVLIRPLFPRMERPLGSFVLRYSWKLMCLLLRCTWNLRLHAPQKKEMEQLRSAIIVANHPSLIDVVILASIIPRCMLIVKPALLRWPFLRPILRRLCIVNNGDAQQMLEATTLLFSRKAPEHPPTRRTSCNEALFTWPSRAALPLSRSTFIPASHS